MGEVDLGAELADWGDEKRTPRERVATGEAVPVAEFVQGHHVDFGPRPIGKLADLQDEGFCTTPRSATEKWVAAGMRDDIMTFDSVDMKFAQDGSLDDAPVWSTSQGELTIELQPVNPFLDAVLDSDMTRGEKLEALREFMEGEDE